MKIGILTHYNVNNQGAQLQMRALMNYLKALGHEVVILTYEKNFDFDKAEDKRNSASIKNAPYYLKNYLFEKGLGLTYFNTKKVMAHKKALEHIPMMPYDKNDCDCVVIGSDEVFSIDVGCNRMMYGHGIDVPCIAYAPAFGRATLGDLESFDVKELIQTGLSEMYSLSARDTHTQDMIKTLTGRDVPLVCDPVILYDCREFEGRRRLIKEKYMLIYSYDRNMIDEEEIYAIKAYAQDHGLKTISCGTYHKWCDESIVCDSLKWYQYFAHAECVVTDTFHGFVAAMKNHANAAVFVRENINAFKLESLLAETGLEDRRLGEFTRECLEDVLSRPIDYEEVDRKLNDMRQESGEYLRNAIAGVEKEKNRKKKKIRSVSDEYREECTGCGACRLVCSEDAVELEINRRGFFEAVIDEDKCIDCRNCVDVCTRFQPIDAESSSSSSRYEGRKASSLYEASLYAMHSSSSQTVMSCSSGGLAHELERLGQERGYVVAGAVYDYDNDIVRTKAVDDITLLDGSKYLQSDMTELIDEIKNDKGNVTYMITGTPCQIAGLHLAGEYLGIRDRMVLVEIFCHGVPPYLLWEKEVDLIRKKVGDGPFDRLQFRFKKDDWHSYCLRAEKDDKVFLGARETDIFWQVFFENVLLGDACMDCDMRKELSFADIRLGDYWGREFQDNSQGVSAVYALTETGRNIVLTLLDRGMVEVLNNRGVEVMLSAQNMGGYSQRKLHDEAMDILENEGIDAAIRYYRKHLSRKQKLKRKALAASAVIPAGTRAKLRKINSSRKLK